MLITPERFLKRAFAESPRALAILIYKKLQIELDPKPNTTDDLMARCSNLFKLAFVDPTQSREVMDNVIARCDAICQENGLENIDSELVLLPPLFFVANDDFVICYNNIFIIASKHGPIIPVVDLQKVREENMLEHLILIYSKSSPNFVDIDSTRDLLMS